MSADLHIHVLEGATEDDLAVFFSNTMGSKWFRPVSGSTESPSWNRVIRTPNVWIGEVSWLKAALFDDAEAYIPDTVQSISDIIGEELPIIDDNLIGRIIGEFNLTNKTEKPDSVWDGKGYALANPYGVRSFLEEHKGKRAFTISW